MKLEIDLLKNYPRTNRDTKLRNLEKNEDIVGSISLATYTNPKISQKDYGLNSICSDNILERRLSFLKNPGLNLRMHSLIRYSALKNIDMKKLNFNGADWALIMDLLKYGKFFLDEREFGFTKTAKGLSSDLGRTKRLSREKLIGYFLPLHELTFYIIKKYGFRFLPSLIKHNIIYQIYYFPCLANFARIIKNKINAK